VSFYWSADPAIPIRRLLRRKHLALRTYARTRAVMGQARRQSAKVRNCAGAATGGEEGEEDEQAMPLRHEVADAAAGRGGGGGASSKT
jgi:hypothetical protein